MYEKMRRILAALLMLALLTGSMSVSAEQVMEVSMEPLYSSDASADEAVFMEVEEMQQYASESTEDLSAAATMKPTPEPTAEPGGSSGLEIVVPGTTKEPTVEEDGESSSGGVPSIDIVTGPSDGNGLYEYGVFEGTLTSFSGECAQFAIPEDVTAIADGVFRGNAYLQSVVVHENVLSIGADAFKGCAELASVSLAEGLQEIGSGAFADCGKLAGIVLPKSVVSIGADAFSGCGENFCVQTYSGSVAAAYCEVNQIAHKLVDAAEELPEEIIATPASSFKYSVKNGKCTISDFKGKETEIVIPAMIKDTPVTAIGASAFADCKKIVSVCIQDGVTSIGSSAFKNCKALQKVIVPASVVKISSNAFSGCKNYALVVDENSWAYNWCIENGKPYELSGKTLDLPTGLSLNIIEDTLGVGEKLQLTGIDSLGSSEGLSYSSSSSAVSVNASGLISAKKAGKATITVRTANYVKAQCKITVKAAPKSISLSAKKMTLYLGQSVPLSWKFNSGAAGSVTFSSNSEFASVDADGVVTALSIGEAKITAATHNGKKATCTVKVVGVPSFVALEENQISLPMCMRAQLKPVIDEGSLTTFSYASSDETIATVDADGVITGVNEGTAIVRVSTHNGFTADCTVEVTLAPTQVFLPEYECALGLKEKITLAPVDNLGGTEGFSFKSSKPSVASVDVNGVVTAKKAGSATITIGTFNGVTTTCKITVKAAPTSVTLSEKKLTLYVGQSLPLSWKLSSKSAGSVTFSSNSECAGVDAEGVVTALSIGEAKITATTYNGKKASCTVKVVDVPSFVMFEQQSTEVPMHMTAQLKPVIDEDALTTFSYASDDETIATVDASGTVTGISAGETSVRVMTHNGHSAVCKVIVTLAPSSIAMPGELTLGLKEKITLTPVDDLGGTDGFSFKSSKTSVASVSAKGVVTAKKVGKATITVSTFNGITEKCVVVVKKAPNSIKLSDKSIALLTGQTHQLAWTITSQSAGSVSFSSNSDCVSVDENGLITAVAEGTAKVTAKTFNGKTASCTITVKSSKYAITSMRTGDGNIYATVSTKDACILYAEVLSEDGSAVIFSASAPVEGMLELDEVAARANEAFPVYYMLRAVLLDANGDALCNYYITKRYTAAYEEFENQTPEDYENERVLNFGGSNFGVLADSVISISGGVTVKGDEYSFTPDREIKVGDVLLLNGEPVKVGEILVGGLKDTLTQIRRDWNIFVPEVYKSVRIDGYVDIGDAMKNGSSAKLRDMGNDEASIEMLKFGFDIPVNDYITVTPELSGIVRIKLFYDAIRFDKNYYETEYYVEAGGKIDVFVGAGFDINKALEIGDVMFPIGTTGLFFDLELNVPFKLEAKAGGTITYNCKFKKGMAYTPDMGKQEINEEAEPTAEFKLGGEFTAAVGVAISGGVSFLEDCLRLAINGEVGLQAKGELMPINTEDKMNASKTYYHACTACLDITASVYGEFYANATGRFNKTASDAEIVRLTIVRGEVPILEFYYSLVNEAISVHEGCPVYGLGDCPNNKYRCTIYTVDEYGEDLEGISVTVTRSGMADCHGVSTYQIYLYPGSYSASGVFDGYTVSRGFAINNRAGGTTLNAPAFSLNGYVTDANTGKAVSGATVAITLANGDVFTQTTDAEGFYNFRNLKAGDCSVKITHKRYEEKLVKNLRYGPDTVNQLNADLVPLPYFPLIEAFVAQGGRKQALPMDGSSADGIPEIFLETVADKWGNVESVSVSYEGCAEPFVYDDSMIYFYSARLTGMDMGNGKYTLLLEAYAAGTIGGSEVFVLQAKNGKLEKVKAFTLDEQTDEIYVTGKFTTASKFSGVIYPTKTKFTGTVASPSSERVGKEIWANGTGYLDYQENEDGYYDLIFTTSERCLFNADCVGNSKTLYKMENGEIVLKKQWYEASGD